MQMNDTTIVRCTSDDCMQNIDECDVKHGDYILQILLSMLFLFYRGNLCTKANVDQSQAIVLDYSVQWHRTEGANFACDLYYIYRSFDQRYLLFIYVYIGRTREKHPG